MNRSSEPTDRSNGGGSDGMGRLGLVHGVALGMLGVVLLVLIFTLGLAAALATRDPQTALWLNPHEPRALLTLARQRFDAELAAAEANPTGPSSDPDVPSQRTSPAADDRRPGEDGEADAPFDAFAGLARRVQIPPVVGDEAAAPAAGGADGTGPAPGGDSSPAKDSAFMLASRAVASQPLNASALAILGQLADRDGDTQRAGALMEVAARISRRESAAVYWLMQRAVAAKDTDAILQHADVLLRTRRRALPLVVPVLAQLVETEETRRAVVDLLANTPPWRSAFLNALPNSIRDARTPLYLLLALKQAGHPPLDSEVRAYIRFLVGRQLHEVAYYTWLQFLPEARLASLTPLTNGSFEETPSGFPFDWTLTQGAGVTTEIRPLPQPDEGHALVVSFSQGRAEFSGVSQTVMLPPGTYTLKGRVRGELEGTRGLVWRVACIGQKPVAQSELLRGDIPTWREFSLPVTIPATGCRAQTVSLVVDARSESEKFLTGALWFDALDLKRSGLPDGG